MEHDSWLFNISSQMLINVTKHNLDYSAITNSPYFECICQGILQSCSSDDQEWFYALVKNPYTDYLYINGRLIVNASDNSYTLCCDYCDREGIHLDVIEGNDEQFSSYFCRQCCTDMCTECYHAPLHANVLEDTTRIQRCKYLHGVDIHFASDDQTICTRCLKPIPDEHHYLIGASSHICYRCIQPDESFTLTRTLLPWKMYGMESFLDWVPLAKTTNSFYTHLYNRTTYLFINLNPKSNLFMRHALFFPSHCTYFDINNSGDELAITMRDHVTIAASNSCTLEKYSFHILPNDEDYSLYIKERAGHYGDRAHTHWNQQNEELHEIRSEYICPRHGHLEALRIYCYMLAG